MDKLDGPRILCVEDDVFIRGNAVEALHDAGFQVLQAENAHDAIKLLHDPDSVDAVFTDVRMPGLLDGVDLVAYIRQHHPHMPALVTSGYAKELRDRLDAIEPPLTFLAKPYSLASVVDTLRDMTAKRSTLG